MGSIVWLVSYPKSGNTWMRAVLAGLRDPTGPLDINRLAQTSEHGATRRLFDAYAGVSSSDLTREEIDELRPGVYEALAAELGGEAILKLHDAYRRASSGRAIVPSEVTRAVVHIVRNPLDIACSYAHHRGADIDETIDVLGDSDHRVASRSGGIDGQLPQHLGTWSGHVRSWLTAAELPVLTVRYEDMHADPVTTFGAVARRLGWTPDTELLQNAIARAAFERLRRQEELHGFVEGSQKAARFFRRGIAGAWRCELSPEQVERVLRDHGQTMRVLGYVSPDGNIVP